MKSLCAAGVDDYLAETLIFSEKSCENRRTEKGDLTDIRGNHHAGTGVAIYFGINLICEEIP